MKVDDLSPTNYIESIDDIGGKSLCVKIGFFDGWWNASRCGGDDWLTSKQCIAYADMIYHTKWDNVRACRQKIQIQIQSTRRQKYRYSHFLALSTAYSYLVITMHVNFDHLQVQGAPEGNHLPHRG